MRRPIPLLLIAAAALTVLFLLPGASAADGNDASTNATPISPGMNGPFDIEPAGDVDWYAFTLSARSAFLLETSGASGSTWMNLYDANISTVGYDDGSAYPWTRISGLLEAGSYFARVVAANGTPTITNYSLKLLAAPPAPLADGPNGPYNFAPNLLPNWFTFDVAEASYIDLQLNGSSGNSYMALYDANLSFLTSDGYYGNLSWSHILYATSPGSYFVYVRSSNSYSPLTDFYVTLTRSSLAGADGNGIMANATPIVLGTNGPFDLDPAYELDYYVITFTDAGIAQFQLYGASWNTYFTLYDQNGSYLRSAYGSDALLQGAVEARTYYVLAQDPYYGGTAYGYMIEVSFLVPPPPDGNDDKGSATPVGGGQSGPYSLYGTDLDWYVFVADVPGTLAVTISPPSYDVNMIILDSQNNTLGYGGNYSYGLTARVDAGTYYIVVGLSYGQLVMPSYNLTITFTPYVSPDGNDFRSVAQKIVPGPNGPFAIDPYDDIDWYFFEAEAAGAGWVQIEAASLPSGSTIALYDANGSWLNGGYFYSQNLTWTFEVARYFVKVANAYGYTIDSYIVNLSLPDNTPPVLGITSPANGSSIDTYVVTIAGMTEPGAHVSLNGVELVVNASGGFSTQVLLTVGLNNFDIRSRDWKGNEAQQVLVITGVDPKAALEAELAAKNAELAATNAELAAQAAALAAIQAQLAAARAAAAAAANQSAAANASVETQQQALDNANRSVETARADAAGQRGFAMVAMTFGGIIAAAAVVAALMLLRRRPPMPQARGAAPSDEWAPVRETPKAPTGPPPRR
jgi:hypothetical protein